MISMLYHADMTVDEIVRVDYRAAEVFEKHNIDVDLNGGILLSEACKKNNMDCNTLVEELKTATRNVRISNKLPFDQWEIDFLIDFILNVHHSYLNEALPSLKLQLLTFLDRHKKPDLMPQRLHKLFAELSELLTTHARHEEEVIFPYIRQINSVYRRKESYGNLFVRTLRKPLTSAEAQHQAIEAILKEIASCTNNYRASGKALTMHRVIYQKLEELHDDLAQHTYLEHQVLFPKAIEIERQLLQLKHA
jgi:regulator of cell morphogenesis and NO signaling